jgi:Ran GTPase-activating protein (RanGAP) involved in mRNA processing and transport
LIAFGIFTEAEQRANLQNDARYGQNLDMLLKTNSEFCLEEARRALLKYSDEAVGQRMEGALNDFKSRATVDHKKFRWCGVGEAMLAAFFWALLLLAIAAVIVFVGVDVIDVPRKVREYFHR